MNETRELAKLRGLSVYGRDDIERLAKLTCVATDGRLPRADAPLRVGADQWYRLTALRFLRGCRRTRPATGLADR